MKPTRAIAGVTLLACLVSAGCTAVPMTYAEWKKNQGERAQYAEAGVPYKSPAQLQEEAAGMRRAAQETIFVPGSK